MIRARFSSAIGALNFFFSSSRRHTRCLSDWSSDVCSCDLQYFLDDQAALPIVGIDRLIVESEVFSVGAAIEIECSCAGDLAGEGVSGSGVLVSCEPAAGGADRKSVV